MAKPTDAPSESNWASLFTGLLGLSLALALIKLGTPVILDDEIRPPSTLYEVLLQPWPFAWGCLLVMVAAAVGFWKFFRWQGQVPLWLVLMPATWFTWQLLAASRSVAPELTAPTIRHFGACTVLFYLGLFALGNVANLRLFWIGVIGGFFVVVLVGWEQHFGGLERTREYFYSLPNWRSFPPEFLKKVASNRIYGTMFYPNAFSGGILLLLPVSLYRIWCWSRALPAGWRFGITLVATLLGLGGLFWSGSKAGWLILLGQAAFVFFHSPIPRRTRITVVAVLLVAGTTGFWAKYRDYFDRGATSTTARFDYWRAAWRTLLDHPLVGTGPGTFMMQYKQLKAPESEMARLAHNDYLQQGSDSGWFGMLAFVALISGAVGLSYSGNTTRGESLGGSVWVGNAGFACQSMVEFGLYIPGLAWIYFLLLGLLCAWQLDGKRIDNGSTPY